MIQFLILPLTIFCFNSAYCAENVNGAKTNASGNTQYNQKNKAEKITKVITPGSKETISDASNPLKWLRFLRHVCKQ